MFTQNDLQTLQAKGITEADACKQLHRFKSGFHTCACSDPQPWATA